MEKQIQEILEKVNIDISLSKEKYYYVGHLESYEDFVDAYNKLERSLDVFKNSLASFMNEDESHVQFETDDGLLIELVAILDEDDYTINITKDEDN